MEDAKNVLNTYYGSRFFNREFGVDLLDYLFSPISNGVLMIIKKIIRETIINNIKEVLDVVIDIKIIDEKLDIKLILKTSKKDIETETRFYLR
jgi:phage baseplate assembly protein W